ncbi:MAG TPA: hypothetical protein VLG11_06335, partial [Candidatus Saccharimonadales bacterium]|nr:hypothetical protein [Candidatus Saccharimonadales bacterium]
MGRSFSAVALGFILVALPLIGIFTPEIAHANGETYTWTSNTTIQVTAGNTRGDAPSTFTNPNVLTRQGNGTTLPGGKEFFTGSFYYDSGSSLGCILTVQLVIQGNNSQGDVSATYSGASAGGGGVGECSQAIYNSFTAKTVAIQGTRSGTAGETDYQKSGDITVYSNTTYGAAPNSMNFTLKDATGKNVIRTDNAAKQDGGPMSTPQDPLNEHAAKYVVNYPNMDPASGTSDTTYYICGDYIIPAACQQITKKYGDHLTVVIGDQPVNAIIKTTVTFSYQGRTTDGDITFGPYTIKLTDKDGNDLNNAAQTDTFTVKGLGGSENTTVTNNTVSLIAFTRDVAPGDYQVCLVGTTECRPVHKNQGSQAEVTITLTDAEARDAVIAAENGNGLGDSSNTPTCESTPDNNAWFLCPIFNGVSNFTDWMYSNFLQPFLYTAPISTSANDSSFKVWSTFRVYG